MYYDREYIDDTNGAQLDRVLSRPVKAKINMTAEYSDDCKSVITHSTVEFAESLNKIGRAHV